MMGFLKKNDVEETAVNNAAAHFAELAEHAPDQAIKFLSFLFKRQPEVLKEVATKNYNIDSFEKDSYWILVHKMAEYNFFANRWNSYPSSANETQDLVGNMLKQVLDYKSQPEKVAFFTSMLEFAFSQNATLHKKLCENKYVYLSQIDELNDLVELLINNGFGRKVKLNAPFQSKH